MLHGKSWYNVNSIWNSGIMYMVPLVFFQNIWGIICVFSVTWKVPEKMCKKLLRVGTSIECGGNGQEGDWSSSLYLQRTCGWSGGCFSFPIFFGFWLLVSAYLNSILRVGLSALVCVLMRGRTLPLAGSLWGQTPALLKAGSQGGSRWPLSTEASAQDLEDGADAE